MMGEQINKKVPAIRFKGFEDEWQEKRLGEIAIFLNGRAYSQHELLDEGQYRVLRVGNFYTNSSWYYSNMRLADKFYANKGDLLYTWSASFGPHIWEGEKVIYHYHIWKIELSYELEKSFALQLLENDKKRLLENSSGSTMVHITKSGMEGKNIVVPHPEEQKKVGSFFKTLDTELSLHQTKLDKLNTLKQAMLQKMFPQGNATEPEIRFKGFSGEWKKQSLESISNPVSNNSLSRAMLTYECGAAKNIHYGDILVRFDAVLNADRPDMPFITEQMDIDKLNGSALKEGDIVFADAAEDQTVGKSVELVAVGEHPVFAGLHTIAFRPTCNFAKGYLGYYTNSESYRSQLYALMQGTKVLSLSRNSLKSTHISHPQSLQEQQKIANYFRKLDKLIALERTQLDKLKQIKQACLAGMFI